MRIRAILAALALASLAFVGPAQGDRPEALKYPTLAAKNTFHADGVTGIVLRAPKDLLWRSENIELTAGKRTNNAMVAFRNRRADRELCDLCFFGTFARYIPNSPYPSPWVFGCANDAGREVGCKIPAGLNELYFISDGPVTFSIDFPELKGRRLKLDVTGRVDGDVRRVPGKCAVPDCSIVRGFVTEKIGLGGTPAFANIDAWVMAPPATPNNVMEANVKACAYPGFFNEKSPDPRDHPNGCDVTDRNESYWLEPYPFFNGGGVGETDVSGLTHGKQYLGFTIRHRSTLKPARWAAYASWIDAGIGCPSRDFSNCNR